MSSENPSGADNQQETVTFGRILRDCTRGSSIDTTSVPTGEGRMRMKIQSDPHGDMGSQTEMIWPLVASNAQMALRTIGSNNSA